MQKSRLSEKREILKIFIPYQKEVKNLRWWCWWCCYCLLIFYVFDFPRLSLFILVFFRCLMWTVCWYGCWCCCCYFVVDVVVVSGKEEPENFKLNYKFCFICFKLFDLCLVHLHMKCGSRLRFLRVIFEYFEWKKKCNHCLRLELVLIRMVSSCGR